MRVLFEDFELDTVSGRLLQGDREIELQPLSLGLLTFLLDHPGTLFSRDELLKQVWPDAIVSDESLSKAVSRLRKALGRKDLVETVPRRGYRLTCAVRRVEERAAEPMGVPAFADPWFGREAELADLRERIDRGQRLITLKGPSGTGKTRMAVELARQVPLARSVFVDLSPCRSAEDVVQAAAGVLGLGSGSGALVRRVGYALARLGPALVVLDNLEPVADHAAETVGWWIRDAPDAVFLVTSQVVLGLRGERVIELGGLAVDRAVELFVERADLPADTEGVEALVRALDGWPLAIELAASRARILPVPELLAGLSDRFALLRARHPDRPARHASLEAALGTSWSWLDPEERAAMVGLTVFRGGFDVQACAAVTGEGLDRLQDLVDRSMVQVDRSRARFRLSAAMREYALLHASDPEVDRATERWAAWLAGFGSDAALDAIRDGDPARIEPIRTWLPDLRAAAAWSLDRGHIAWARACALAAVQALRITGPYGPIAELLDRIRRADDEAPMRLLHATAQMLELSGRHERSIAVSRRLLRRATEAGDRRLQAIAHIGLAHAVDREQSELAAEHAQAAREAASAGGLVRELGTALLFLANVRRRQGDWAGYVELATEGVERLEALDDPRLDVVLLANRALIAQGTGEPERAITLLERGLRRAAERGDRLRCAEILGLLGGISGRASAFEEAADVWRDLGRPGQELASLEAAANALSDEEQADRRPALQVRAGRIRDALGL